MRKLAYALALCLASSALATAVAAPIDHDPRLPATLAAWERCMHAHAPDFPHPDPDFRAFKVQNTFCKAEWDRVEDLALSRGQPICNLGPTIRHRIDSMVRYMRMR